MHGREEARHGEAWHHHDEPEENEWSTGSIRDRLSFGRFPVASQGKHAPTLEERVARLEEKETRIAHLERRLEQRLEMIEGKLGVVADEDVNTPLNWLLSQPDLRQRYQGKFIAVSTVGQEYKIAAIADELEILLGKFTDLSMIYVHQVV